MAEAENNQPEPATLCGCFNGANKGLVKHKYLGMDENYAEISVLTCSICGQLWLRYHFEIEAFTGSGRWYLGAIDAEQAMRLTAENAKLMLENLGWYFYGGSYYGGRSGKASGGINLNP